MEVWVLYEGNDDLEQGDIFHTCVGVYSTKEKALNAFENREYLFWEDEYEGDLDLLCEIIEEDKKELEKTGIVNDYCLFKTNWEG